MSRRRDHAVALARRVTTAARRDGARRTMLLDVDGTLAPIAPTPAEARVPEATLQSLDDLLAAGWTLAAVSGRPAAEVRSMIPLGRLLVFGSHGLEGSWSARQRSAARKPAATRVVDRIARRIRRLAAPFPAVRVERKPHGLAIHDRGLSPGLQRDWRRLLDPWLVAHTPDGMERLDGKRVVEVRPRDVHKGDVARRMPGFAGLHRRDPSLVGIGDDRTDEDLFAALSPVGLTVRVGRPIRATVAQARLASPAAVGRFLRAVAGATQRRAASAAS